MVHGEEEHSVGMRYRAVGDAKECRSNHRPTGKIERAPGFRLSEPSQLGRNLAFGKGQEIDHGQRL